MIIRNIWGKWKGRIIKSGSISVGIPGHNEVGLIIPINLAIAGDPAESSANLCAKLWHILPPLHQRIVVVCPSPMGN